MEQLKKLSINTALCDMTEITEEVLSSYSELNVNAAAVLLSEESEETTPVFLIIIMEVIIIMEILPEVL